MRKVILTTVAIVVVIIAIPVSFMIGTQVRNEKLLNDTPLKQYTFWYSLDNYPKYKLEAAQMVEDLMDGENAVSEEEACIETINYISDKIYENTINYFLENEDADFADYEVWVAQSQQ